MGTRPGSRLRARSGEASFQTRSRHGTCTWTAWPFSGPVSRVPAGQWPSESQRSLGTTHPSEGVAAKAGDATRDSRTILVTRGAKAPPTPTAAAARRQAHFRVMVHPRAGIFATQTRVTRPSTFDSHVPHCPSSQLNLMGARAALTTSFMRWPGRAWTVRDPIFTATVFFCVLTVSYTHLTLPTKRIE